MMSVLLFLKFFHGFLKFKFLSMLSLFGNSSFPALSYSFHTPNLLLAPVTEK